MPCICTSRNERSQGHPRGFPGQVESSIGAGRSVVVASTATAFDMHHDFVDFCFLLLLINIVVTTTTIVVAVIMSLTTFLPCHDVMVVVVGIGFLAFVGDDDVFVFVVVTVFDLIVGHAVMLFYSVTIGYCRRCY